MIDKSGGKPPTAVERAFELARSGDIANVEKLLSRLHREGYKTDGHFGPALRKQLKALINGAKPDGQKAPSGGDLPAMSDEAAIPETPKGEPYDGSPV